MEKNGVDHNTPYQTEVTTCTAFNTGIVHEHGQERARPGHGSLYRGGHVRAHGTDPVPLRAPVAGYSEHRAWQLRHWGVS